MSHVFALFNVFRSVTEQTWLDVMIGLSRRGYHITCGYESLAEPAVPCDLRQVRMQRVSVEPTDDVASQMDRLAARPPGSAMGKPDLVHCHFGPRILWAAPYLKGSIPTIVSLYGYDASRLLRDPCWPARYRWAADHGAIFVTMADAMAMAMRDAGLSQKSIRIIHMGVRLSDWLFEPTPAPTPPRFIFVGRLTPKKAPHLLLHALSSVPDAIVDIVGDGPLKPDLLRLATELHLNNRVNFHGAIDRRQVRTVLRDATAFVLPSVTAPDGDREGTPIVLMEAQALGVPCITTNHSGNGEVLACEARDRFLVPENDPTSLAHAMRQMIELSPADRLNLQLASRRWIENQFDLARTVDHYDHLYRELLA